MHAGHGHEKSLCEISWRRNEALVETFALLMVGLEAPGAKKGETRSIIRDCPRQAFSRIHSPLVSYRALRPIVQSIITNTRLIEDRDY